MWQFRKQHTWLAFSLLLLGAGATLAFQVYTAQSYTNNVWWWPLTIAVFVAGIGILAVGTMRRFARTSVAGFGFVMIALLITPGIWSGLTTFSNTNQTLPAAYGGQSNLGNFSGYFGQNGSNDQNGLQVNETLLEYLQKNTQGMEYLMAVPSSHDGDGYILATGRPVLLMGGFSGSDPVVDASDLSQLISARKLRYIMLGGNGPENQNSVFSWVTANCQVVTGLSTSSRNTMGGRNGSFVPGGGGTLYDCH
jgi:hypothetical protein